MSLSIGIAGLGRVGRAILRANFTQSPGGRFDIPMICDVMPVDQVAYLLAHDSTYGKPPFTVEHHPDSNVILIDNKPIHYVQVDRRQSAEQSNFEKLKQFNLNVLINATGTAQIDDLRKLIDGNVTQKVLCSWNISGGDISLVYGVNDHLYDNNLHHVISASTCTGNAFTPIAHILNKHFGIDYARIITIHPVLSDQNLLDGFQKSPHLGRTASASIVPTKTNVANSAMLALPSLTDKIDSFSYRVPTEIVSAMDISAQLSRHTSLEECTELFEQYAQNSMSDILHCDYGTWGHDKVSIDYLGYEYSAILLMKHLVVSNGKQIGISLMHDNERGYSCRALDILGVLSRSPLGKE